MNSNIKWLLCEWLMVATVSVCLCEFCDEGPTGRYCLKDLNGYHDCHIDPETKKMVDTVYLCAQGTRCQCFWGPPCAASVENPCAEYRTPPSFPPKFSLYIDIQEQHCNETKCSKVIFRQEQWYQDKTQAGKQNLRVDDNLENYEHSSIWTQMNASSFNLYDARFDKEQCFKYSTTTIPSINIPAYYSYEGTVVVGGKVLEEWMWKTGGHRKSDPTTSNTWFIWNNDEHYEPVMVGFLEKSPILKTNKTYFAETTFVKAVDEGKFIPPEYCPKVGSFSTEKHRLLPV